MTRILFIGSEEVFQSVESTVSTGTIRCQRVGASLTQFREALERDGEGTKCLVELSHTVFDTRESLLLSRLDCAGLAVSTESAGLAYEHGIDVIICGPEQLSTWLEGSPAHTGEVQVSGSLIVVMGVAGGIGASTIALTVAGLLAHAGRPVVLIDADTYHPALGFYAGLPPDDSGLVGAIRMARNSGVVSEDILLKTRMIPESSGNLRVLTGVHSTGDFSVVEPEPWKNLLRAVVDSGYTVIVDIAPYLETYPDEVVGGLIRNGAAQTALGAATSVILVSTPQPLHTARAIEKWPLVVKYVNTSDITVCLNGVTRTTTNQLAEVREALWALAGIQRIQILPHDPAVHGGGPHVGASLLRHLHSGPLGTVLSGSLGLAPHREATSSLRNQRRSFAKRTSSSFLKAITLKR